MKKSIIMIAVKIRNGEPLTDSEKMEYINYSISTHSGKLDGIPSISTSCLCNEYCIKRSQCTGLICHECYAMGYCDFRKELREKLELNTLFYTNYTIPEKAVPLLNTLYFRFESFGDLNNELQFINYATIAEVNSGVNMALWTKNPWIIAKAIKNGCRVPKNLKIIYSIPKKNQVITKELFRKIKKKWPFINAIFTVHDEKSIRENRITINCGGKSCRECGFSCYRKSCRVTLINEKEK